MKQLVLTLVFISLGILTAGAQSIVVPNNEVNDQNAPLTYALKGHEVLTESGGVSFGSNSAEVLPVSNRTLNTIKKYLEDKSYISMLRIEGHVSCGEGSQRLSELRAFAVYNWLIKAGVDCKRLMAVGFGCTKPITDANNELNARITFVNAALRERPIGGMPLDGGGVPVSTPCK